MGMTCSFLTGCAFLIFCTLLCLVQMPQWAVILNMYTFSSIGTCAGCDDSTQLNRDPITGTKSSSVQQCRAWSKDTMIYLTSFSTPQASWKCEQVTQVGRRFFEIEGGKKGSMCKKYEWAGNARRKKKQGMQACRRGRECKQEEEPGNVSRKTNRWTDQKCTA